MSEGNGRGKSEPTISASDHDMVLVHKATHGRPDGLPPSITPAGKHHNARDNPGVCRFRARQRGGFKRRVLECLLQPGETLLSHALHALQKPLLECCKSPAVIELGGVIDPGLAVVLLEKDGIRHGEKRALALQFNAVPGLEINDFIVNLDCGGPNGTGDLKLRSFSRGALGDFYRRSGSSIPLVNPVKVGNVAKAILGGSRDRYFLVQGNHSGNAFVG